MKKEEIYERLNNVFRDIFDDISIVVNEKTTSNDIEDWDSLEHINLVVAVEQEFGIKFNIEQILLPSELCKSRGSHYRIIFGKPIRWQSLAESGKSHKELATEIRSASYSLQTN